MINMQPPLLVHKIISGGQTGVDRAALDAALQTKFPCGGKCPKDRKSEDGCIPDFYPLKEMSSHDYRVRTKANIADSNGTLIITRRKPEGGTLLTVNAALKTGRPVLVIDVDLAPSLEETTKEITQWCIKHSIITLNIAGPRASKDPDIYQVAYTIIYAFIGFISRERAQT